MAASKCQWDGMDLLTDMYVMYGLRLWTKNQGPRFNRRTDRQICLEYNVDTKPAK